MARASTNATRVSLLGCILFAACTQGGNLGSGSSDPGDPVKRSVPTVASLQKGQGPQRQALPVAASDDESAALLAKHPDLQAFLANEGRGWTVSFDRRSGQPMLLQGPGIAWMPGAGNDLGSSSEGGNFLSLPAGDRLLAMATTAETRARGLLASRPALLGKLAGGDLIVDRNWTGSPDEGGDLLYATFRHAPAGIEQHDARLTFVISHGNLIQIHAERIVPGNADLQPRITPAQAFARLAEGAQIPALVKPTDQDLKAVLLATKAGAPGVYNGAVGSGYEQRLAYQFHFQIDGDTKAYAGWVDAQTGELLELFDDNKYVGATGGIFPRTNNQAEVVVPFVDTTVTNSTAKVTDLGGNYSYSGGTATSALGGANLKVTDSCGAPAASSTTGEIAFGTSTATDCSFSPAGSHTTRGARNAFYHLNNVRRMGQKHLGGFNTTATNWFGTDVTVNVNLAQTCNAFWDGSAVNFFKSGGGCNNTGEISDVMQHEWGHGLDQNTKSGSVGDSAKGEAVADSVALLMTHDGCVGPNFFQTTGNGETAACPTGVRDMALVVTQANIGSVCTQSSSCAGALGYECHCESHLLSGAHYKLAQAFVAKYGANEGWNRFERGYLRALPGITAYLKNTAGNAYDAWMAADDDNGNVTDGTPNGDIIFTAFNSQGLAGTQRVAHSVTCPATPAAGPTVTASGDAGSVGLTWTAVSGATSYSIFRTQAHNDGAGFLPLAAGVTGTAFTDAQVRGGYSYSYQVVGNLGACTTAYSASPATATPTGGTTPPPTNDFSVGVSPSSTTLAAGATATISVSTAVTSGSAQTISLSISGLPAGVTGAFSPTSVSAGAGATLTLTASSTAAAATATYTVTGSATSGSHTATGSVTVTTSGGGGGGTVLTNGVAVTGISGATGSAVTYTLAVPAGQTSLVFAQSGGTGDADMYVKSGSAPTTTVYDCRPYVAGNSETCTFANPAAGTWYVTIRGYAAFTGVSLKGTYTGGTGGGDPYLTNGVAVTGISGATGSSQYWRLAVPAGQAKVVFTISGGTGDADLYVQSAARPTTTSYVCRPYLTGNAETCTITGPAAGDYYVMLRGYAAFTGVSLKGTYP